MENVDRTGTYILKPIIIIHQICVEVEMLLFSPIYFYSMLLLFVQRHRRFKVKKVVVVGIVAPWMQNKEQVHHYKTNTNNSLDLCRNDLDYSVWYILLDVISKKISIYYRNTWKKRRWFVRCNKWRNSWVNKNT